MYVLPVDSSAYVSEQESLEIGVVDFLLVGLSEPVESRPVQVAGSGGISTKQPLMTYCDDLRAAL